MFDDLVAVRDLVVMLSEGLKVRPDTFKDASSYTGLEFGSVHIDGLDALAERLDVQPIMPGTDVGISIGSLSDDGQWTSRSYDLVDLLTAAIEAWEPRHERHLPD